MDAIYKAKATVTGGRSGHVRTADGVLDMDLRPPKEMGGEEGYANPELLFAAGYAACYNSALMLAARRKRLDADNAEVTVTIGIDRDDTSYKLSARIDVKFFGIDDHDAQYLIEEAHKLCPYSKATRGNVDVELHYTKG